MKYLGTGGYKKQIGKPWELEEGGKWYKREASRKNL